MGEVSDNIHTLYMSKESDSFCLLGSSSLIYRFINREVRGGTVPECFICLFEEKIVDWSSYFH